MGDPFDPESSERPRASATFAVYSAHPALSHARTLALATARTIRRGGASCDLIPAGTAGSSGLTVSVRTADGAYDVSYLHLASLGVRRGATVAAGGPIGTVGTSGVRSAAEPHLHFGVRRAGSRHEYVDPLGLLPPPSAPAPRPPAAVPVTAPSPVRPSPARWNQPNARSTSSIRRSTSSTAAGSTASS